MVLQLSTPYAYSEPSNSPLPNFHVNNARYLFIVLRYDKAIE